MSTITASLINLTNSTPQNGNLSTQPKNPARCPLDPLAQQAKSVLIPITKRGISTPFIHQKHRHTGVCGNISKTRVSNEETYLKNQSVKLEVVY